MSKAKYDVKKEFKKFYTGKAGRVDILEVPAQNYIMIDGKGNPNTDVYQRAMTALYGVIYTIKFARKNGEGPDFTVPPLESLWWSDDITAFSEGRKDEWIWTSMILVPEFVTAEEVEPAKKEIEEKKGLNLDDLRFEKFEEGLCAQILHIGPYSEEAPTIEQLHKEAEEKGYKLRDKHHELYIGDPRRSKPEKLKTIIRQPIEKM